MRQLIEQYQANGNREVIEQVLELSEQDLKGMLDAGHIPESDLFYVAYRIRAILMKNALHNFNFKNRNNGNQFTQDRRDLEEYIEVLFEGSSLYEEKPLGEYSINELRELEEGLVKGFKKDIENLANEYAEELFLYFEKALEKATKEMVDKPFDEITFSDMGEIQFSEVARGNFSSIKERELYYIEETFNEVKNLSFKIKGQASYHKLMELIDKLEDLNTDGEHFKEQYEKVKAELLPPLVKGLEHALSKVDPKRSSREVVKYMNRAMLTKYIELVQEKEGKKRIYSHQDKKNYFIKPKYEVDAWKLILDGKTLNKGLDSFNLYLTKKQKELLENVHSIVSEELQRENSQAFRWNKTSEPVIQKRFIAKKLGVNENSFKQRLKRATDKIHENWEEASKNQYA